MVGVDRRGRWSKINKNVWTSKNTDDKEKEKKKAVAKHFALHAYAKNDFDRRLNVFSFVFTISCQRRVQKPVKYLRWSVLRKKVATALNSSNIPAFFEDFKTIIAYSLP